MIIYENLNNMLFLFNDIEYIKNTIFIKCTESEDVITFDDNLIVPKNLIIEASKPIFIIQSVIDNSNISALSVDCSDGTKFKKLASVFYNKFSDKIEIRLYPNI